MERLILPDGYYLHYAYSLNNDEFYCRVTSCNFVFSEENFRRNHPLDSVVQGNGHIYRIIDIRNNNGELLICLSKIK